ncbi:hypothetical protein [Methylotenera sp.]|uniref:hypothetical protein n=1 Tax=Methylotenera sp. TaxID=2051956 RepID=UPI002ED79B25
MTDNLTILTAAEASLIAERINRWRDQKCHVVMKSTLAKIKEQSKSGHRKYLLEGVGSDVDFDAFILELEGLGYTVAQAGEEYLNRSLIITW